MNYGSSSCQLRLFRAVTEGIAVEWHELPKGILGHYFAEPGITLVITLSPILENKETLMRFLLKSLGITSLRWEAL